VGYHRAVATALRIVMLLAPVVAVVWLGLGHRRMRAFERATPRLASLADLEALRRIAAFQIRAAVGAVPLFIVPFFCMSTLKQIKAATGLDATLGSTLAALAFFVGLGLRAPERRLQSLPADGEVRLGYEHLVRTWRKTWRPSAVK